MEISELKSNWKSAKNNINTDFGLQPDDTRKTALQRLSNQYRRFSIFAIIMLLTGPNILYNAGVKQIWLIVVFALILGESSIVDHYLSNAIRAINLAKMPVTEVIGRTMRCRKIHLWTAAVNLPLVIFWCAAMAYTMKADIYFVSGMCAGGLIGLILGIHTLMRFLRDYRDAMQ